VALPVLGGAKDLLTVQAVLFGLQGAVVNGLRLENLAIGPLENLLRGGDTNSDRVKFSVAHISRPPFLLIHIVGEIVGIVLFDHAVAGNQIVIITLSLQRKAGSGEFTFGVCAEAEELIVNTKANQVGALAAAAMKANDFATAAGYYQQMVDMNPSNGAYHLSLGNALYKMKDWTNAVAALETAAANGQAAKANGVLSNLYVARCQESLKLKKYQDALDFAAKANEIKESANAYKLGASAARVLGKLSVCEEMYLKYLELRPNASDASDIKLTLAASYQKAGNKAKAREYYQMLVNDPKHGATAKAQLPTLK
jgi:tetratricopeptide (TPR) repeat protein